MNAPEDFGDELAEFSLAPAGQEGPGAIFDGLVRSSPHLDHLKGTSVAVAFLLRHSGKVKHGRQILGTCYMPTVQGELRGLFDWLLEEKLGFRPDFLVVLDSAYWAEATALQREILVFHEALHMGQAVDKYGEPKFDKDTGEPIWALRGHDLEEFNAVVSEYGSHSPDVVAFLAAVRHGDELAR